MVFKVIAAISSLLCNHPVQKQEFYLWSKAATEVSDPSHFVNGGDLFFSELVGERFVHPGHPTRHGTAMQGSVCTTSGHPHAGNQISYDWGNRVKTQVEWAGIGA
jgi:hypothetical protein